MQNERKYSLNEKNQINYFSTEQKGVYWEEAKEDLIGVNDRKDSLNEKNKIQTTNVAKEDLIFIDSESEMNTKSLLSNYAKDENFIIEKTSGCEIYDTHSREFLDMYAGICVNNLGHNPVGWTDILSKSGSEMTHVGNYFYNKNEIKLSNLLSNLVEESIPDAKVFFCNSGAEANEAALKLAILQNQKNNNAGNIMSMVGAFHGRTAGSLSCTYNPSYREPFKQILSEVHFWQYNQTEGLEEYILKNNIKIIINEPIQGENGVIPMTEAFAESLKDLHCKHKFVWIIDEIQVGLGRYGRMFAHQLYGIRPDYVTLAKALGNGIPIGSVICKNAQIAPGQHGTTFGGNPFCTAVAYWVLNKIINDKLPEQALKKGEYFKSKLQSIKSYFEKQGSNKIVDIRGQGLLIGVQFKEEILVKDILKKLFSEGILCIAAGNNTLRLCPPLIISTDQIDYFIRKLKNVLEMKVDNYDYTDVIPQIGKNKNIVWKISGDIDENNFIKLLKKFDFWSSQGYNIALIYGAGTAINKELSKTNLNIEYVNGQRKTTLEMIDVIKNVVETQKQKLLKISDTVLNRKKLTALNSPIFTATSDLMSTHGYVLEPSSADIEPIKKIWENNSIALVPFLSIMNDQIYNSNADLCTSCLAISLEADWCGYSVGHENDISKLEENSISLSALEKDIKNEEFTFTDGFLMKLKEIRKIFDAISKDDLKCFIGNDDIPDYFNSITKNGVWIRKKHKYSVGLVGSRGMIGSEIVKYIHKNHNFKLFRFSYSGDENTSEEIKTKFPYYSNYLENPFCLIESDKKKEKENINKLSSWEEINFIKEIDIWINACPNNVLKKNIHLIHPSIPIVDVSSDFRHIEGWEYAMCYINSTLINNRISNPGCYSSAVISALYPLSQLKNSSLDAHITAISSYSGAGRDYLTKFPSLHETIIAYQPLHHSQQHEMQSFLKSIPINFVPMVTDQFARGIIASIQVSSTTPFSMDEITKLYKKYYDSNEFISCIWDKKSVITTDAISDTTNIILNNFNLSDDNKILHIQSTIDNLTVGGGFSSYLNMCRYMGLNWNSKEAPIDEVPIQSFEVYDNYISTIKFPHGFRASTTNVPFIAREINRKKVLQFTCIRMDVKSKWTAVYTRNPICGNPVKIGRKRLALNKPIKALWINNKISNVGINSGFDDAEEISQAIAKGLQCEIEEVIPLSTGIIGWRLPKEEMISNVSYVVKGSVSVSEVARAIMTTDSYPKAINIKLSNGGSMVCVGKGAGMIEPNMGTTLIAILTDVDVDKEYMHRVLKETVDDTFNCISIDGDTSTSDAVILISSGLKPKVENEEFEEAMLKICKYMARQIVWNGEGVSHVIEVRIKNCPSKEVGRLIGKNIVNSPLTKSAIYGNDPNVGRIIGSMARKVEGIDWNVVSVKIGSNYIFVDGGIIDFNAKIELEMSDYLKHCQIYEGETKPAYPVHDNSVVIEIEMNQGEFDVTVIGGDLTVDYVKINGDYRS